jgi:hypothetical protein
MASFYTAMRSVGAGQLEGRLDAFKRRWPDATQHERLLAHRLAEVMIANLV